MQYERDAIKKTTLPDLNDEARKHNDEFDFCDLRWGIDTAEIETDEGAKKILEVCLDEIDRCQPPMVVLLGYRYGWIPDAKLIENAAKAKEMQIEDLQKSVTALEIEYGAFRNYPTLYYFREIEGQAPEDYQSEDMEHYEKLSALKQLISEKSGGKIRTYTLKWNGSGFDGTEDFAEMLAEDIKAIFKKEWENYDKFSPLQREMRVHEKFISDKKDVFSARSKEAEELKQRILEQPVTIIKGATGSGKSTLFSRLVTDLKETEWKVLPFISGLTNHSNDAQDIIENIVEFLETELNVSEHYRDEKDRQTGENIRHTPEQWREKLAEMCARYTQEKHEKLLIMIDAVDQLLQNEQRDELHFIPLNVSKNIHFAMTSTLDFDTRSMDFYTLKDIDEDDKREVINGTLKRVHKQLSKNVVDKIVNMKASENPLYISLLVQRLVLMDEDDFKIIRELGDGMPAIEQHQIDIISGCPDDLDKMSAELLRVASKGIDEKMVAKAGEYLAVSRYGLRKSDLAELLGEDWTEVKFSHFINFMYDCFMVRDDGRYDFTHKSIRAGFLKNCHREKLNLEIFNHLKSLPDNDPMRIAEVVYHAIQADDKRFFIDYIRKYEFDNDTSYINQAALDTYLQCMTDGGKWIRSILCDKGMIFHYQIHLSAIINFVNFQLRESFKGKNLSIQRDILEDNKSLAECLREHFPRKSSMRDLELSCDFLGQIYHNMGGKENFRKACELYESKFRLAEDLDEIENTFESKIDLIISYERRGMIFEDLAEDKDLEKALDMYNNQNWLSEELFQYCKTIQVKRLFMLSFNHRARIYAKLAEQKDRDFNLQMALENYENGLKLAKNIDNKEQTDESQKDLSISYEKLADIYTKLWEAENIEKAVDYYNDDIKICRQLYKKNERYARDLYVAYSKLGIVYSKLGGKDNLWKSWKLYQNSLRLAEQIIKSENTMIANEDLAISLYNVAMHPYTDMQTRKQLLERAVQLAKILYDNLPNEKYKSFVRTFERELKKTADI